MELLLALVGDLESQVLLGFHHHNECNSAILVNLAPQASTRLLGPVHDSLVSMRALIMKSSEKGASLGIKGLHNGGVKKLNPVFPVDAGRRLLSVLMMYYRKTL